MNRYDQLAELQRNWTPPAELARSGPRRVYPTGGGIALLVLAGVVFLGGIAAGIAMTGAANRQVRDRNMLREKGREVEGIVTRLWRTGDKESKLMVAYRFEAEGRTFSRSVEASRRIWKTLVVGAPLAVRFVPSNPALNRPRDWAKAPMPGWLPVLVGGLLAAIAAGIVYIVRRQMNFLSEGRPAPAIVTHYSAAQHGQKNIHYEFPVLSGAVAKGYCGPKRQVPAVGATLCVVYDRDNPRRNAVYPMDLVKLEGSASKPVRRGKVS